MEMTVYEVAEADGICYKCGKHVMKDCECFFGRLFIDDQPERLNPEAINHKCTDGKLFVERNKLSFFDKFKGWITHKIYKCPICGNGCDSLNTANK